MIDLLRSLVTRLLGVADAPADRRWVRISLPRETWRFGAAAPPDFAAFLRKPSTVAVNSVGELCDWLRGCAYDRDEVLFGVTDRWQSPADFERLRRGDCEDHALWAWRKLHELGFATELVVGRWLAAGVARDYHAWVVFTDRDGRRMLLEAVTKGSDRMPRPLDEVAREYLPFHAIDGDLQTFTYGGYLLALEHGDPAAR